jgi:hypothetical protein
VNLLLLAALLLQSGAAKKEADAMGAVADEVLKLARFCVANKAYSDARVELDRGIAATGAQKLKDELKKLPSQADGAKADFAKKLAAERAKAHPKCADFLADAAAAWRKEGDTARADQLLWRLLEHYPTDKPLQRIGLDWFSPYFRWMDRAEIERLDAGGEFVDGKWLDQDAVEELNKKHATWDNPWTISDDVHELRTTLPLRDARHLLAFVGVFRARFLREFDGIWDLKKPSGRLPVIVTESQDDLQAQMKKVTGEGSLPQIKGAAYYLQANRPCSPCFVTLEPTDATGRALKVRVEDVLIPLRHEVTHQIAFEYCKHDYDNTRPVRHQFWSVEGVAGAMEYHAYERGRWSVKHPRLIKFGEAAIEGAFAWCQDHRESIPPLEKFTALSQQEMLTVENYHVAATLAYFLLTGEGGKYRRKFAKLLETVHKVRDAESTWRDCFAPTEFATIQREFLKFVEELKID